MHNHCAALVPFAVGLCALFGAAPDALAQTTLLVGPSGLPQIRTAIALAAPGDVIVVEPGTYAHFELSLGVTIRAQQPGTVQVAYDPAFLPTGCASSLTCLVSQGPTTLTLPPGQTAHLCGLDFVGNQYALPVAGLTAFHHVAVTSGIVVAEDCTFAASGAHSLRVSDATLVLLRCSLTTTGTTSLFMPGLFAARSLVHALDSSFTGSQYVFGFAGGNPGILLRASELHGSGLTLTGQLLGPGGGGGGPALVLNSAAGVPSRAWLEDCALIAGVTACAIDAVGQQVALANCTLTQAPTCPAVAPAKLLGITQQQPLQLGQTFALDFRTEPNGFVAVFASPQLAVQSLPLVGQQPILLDATASFAAGLALADAAGAATASWPIPAVPALVDASFWFQGATGFALPFLLSPVAGGRLR